MALSFNGLTFSSGGIQFRFPPVFAPTIGTATTVDSTSATVTYTAPAPETVPVYSAYFSGPSSGSKITFPHNSVFNIGNSAAYTIEAWVYVPDWGSANDKNFPILQKGLSSLGNLEWGVCIVKSQASSTGTLGIFSPYPGSIMTHSGNSGLTPATWYHVAFSRAASTTTTYVYVNGVQFFSVTPDFNYTGTGLIYVGYGFSSVGYQDSYYGYISNLRMVIGNNLYPSGTTFTPPTSALSAITNTQLLTCNTSTIADGSPNNLTPTITTVTTSGSTIPSIGGSGVPITMTAVSNPGNFTGSAVQLSTSGTITVAGLSSSTNYTFTVYATNSEGAGPSSAASNQITTSAEPPGQQAYTTAGTYTWVAPAGVTSVSAVVVGAGGSANAGGGYIAGAGGGALAFKNNYTVTPGGSYTIVVGAGGAVNSGYGAAGGNSYFVSTSVCFAMGGQAAGGTRATYLGDGGGNGGLGTTSTTNYGGNGGAGGYAGQGGDGGGNAQLTGYDGAGGGGGGGGAGTGGGWGANGGGVGLLGQGSNGLGGARATAGTPGSGGSGVLYGAGAGSGATGAVGAVRLIWPGTSRQFPSTNTGDL